MDKIDSIIYFDDLEDMYRFEFEDMTASDYAKAAERIKYEYWTREQLLQLKESYPSEFDKIRSEYILLRTLKRWDLTPDQVDYIDRIKRTSLDISMDEIKHILSLINNCFDFYRQPSLKLRTFPRFIDRYGISQTQTDMENILQNLQTEDFCKGHCSTDNESWRKTFLKFEYNNADLKFSNDSSLPKYGLTLVIYIVIAENLRTNKSVALVSFTSHDFERCILAWDSTKRVNLNFVVKIGSAYIVSVVAKPYSAEDPFFEFNISETSYNKIIHLIEALTIRLQMKYPLHYRCDAYMTHVQYQSSDPINHGLPIPVDYFF